MNQEERDIIPEEDIRKARITFNRLEKFSSACAKIGGLGILVGGFYDIMSSNEEVANTIYLLSGSLCAAGALYYLILRGKSIEFENELRKEGYKN